MNYLLILFISLLTILILFYFLNMKLSYLKKQKKEHFLNFLQYVNDGFNPKIKENTDNTKKIMDNNKFKNFDDIFLKNIYLSYSETSKKYSFYILNYDYKLLMTVFVKKDKSNFDIINNNINNEIHVKDLKNKEKIEKLKNKKHNNYILDLQKLYKNNYNFVILNDYNTIKIYTEFEYDIFYLKKNINNENNELKKYKLFVFNDEIGHINYDNKNYKISIKKKYLKHIYLFCYALIILISNKES